MIYKPAKRGGNPASAVAHTQGGGVAMRCRRAWRAAGMLVLLVPAVTTLVVTVAGEAGAATVTVCPSGCRFTQIGPAIAAASAGDTITVAAGTYSGGFTIDKTLNVAGAGKGSTIISGGGPVVTIGTFGAASEPTVSITGVTITGGVTHSSPMSVPFFGHEGVFAAGGGIEIPPNAGFSGGATVTVADSVITGNRVAPTATVPSGLACPGGSICPLAWAFGGGIDTWGAVTLTNTTLSDNQVGGPVASDADAGGIDSELGSLTLKGSTVTGNQAIASAPNGRFADTGGILAQSGTTLTVAGSLIGDNSARLSTAFRNSVQTNALAGGIHVQGDDSCASPSSGCAVATISDSTFSGNSVTASNSIGDAVSFCGGICDDGSLVLRDSAVSANHVTATVPAGSKAGASADSAGVGTGGVESINDTQITGNTVNANAPDGVATASSGGGSTGNSTVSTISDSLISGNRITATTTSGSASVQGAGFSNGAVLEVRGTTVSDNAGTASGPSGSAQGGGIINDGTLTLNDSTIVHNSLSGTTGITIQGGGLFTAVPVTLKDSNISGNTPDNCFGMSC